ncbi:MAG: hypothetical protein HYX41_01865 [Bdellovibrio sp.]|nr:hypothetical protein [Bdellovibrio sp.]
MARAFFFSVILALACTAQAGNFKTDLEYLVLFDGQSTAAFDGSGPFLLGEFVDVDVLGLKVIRTDGKVTGFEQDFRIQRVLKPTRLTQVTPFTEKFTGVTQAMANGGQDFMGFFKEMMGRLEGKKFGFVPHASWHMHSSLPAQHLLRREIGEIEKIDYPESLKTWIELKTVVQELKGWPKPKSLALVAKEFGYQPDPKKRKAENNVETMSFVLSRLLVDETIKKDIELPLVQIGWDEGKPFDDIFEFKLVMGETTGPDYQDAFIADVLEKNPKAFEGKLKPKFPHNVKKSWPYWTRPKLHELTDENKPEATDPDHYHAVLLKKVWDQYLQSDDYKKRIFEAKEAAIVTRDDVLAWAFRQKIRIPRVKYFTREEQDAIELKFQNRKAILAKSNIPYKDRPGKGEEPKPMFVITEDKRFLAHHKRRGLEEAVGLPSEAIEAIHHSSLSAGEPTISTGRVGFDAQDSIEVFYFASGHFQIGPEGACITLQIVEEKGISQGCFENMSVWFHQAGKNPKDVPLIPACDFWLTYCGDLKERGIMTQPQRENRTERLK